MTALRVTPPSALAISAALDPSRQSWRSSVIRSALQDEEDMGREDMGDVL
jgi:hypothetical protein